MTNLAKRLTLAPLAFIAVFIGTEAVMLTLGSDQASAFILAIVLGFAAYYAVMADPKLQ